MTDASRLSLFASLRRDQLLFALVSTLVLLLHMLQPLAAAQMPQDRHLVICTIHGIADASDTTGEGPASPFDNCPVCLIGGTCAGMTICKVVLDTSTAFPMPGMTAIVSPQVVLQTAPAIRQGSPLPAIRAPPASA